MKAIAVSISERVREVDPVSAKSAQNIEEIADKAYTSVRGMMSRLRPSVLDELGLKAALQNMVGNWNEHHEDTFCRLRIDGDFDHLHDNQQINVYRIVQEALTNIAKHAHAGNAEVIMSGKEVVTLMINDDGIGYEPGQVEQGMGLMGIRERVQTLNGELNIATRPRKGVNVQIEFPRVEKFRRRRATDAGWTR